MKGRIFDIQRFSVHDGPGIRTTVFMKGCPLRCKWCHNPEGLTAEIQLKYIKSDCINCGLCGDKVLKNTEKCPTKALQKCGYDIDEADLLKIILKDNNFYSENGGVTFSGGECLMQADFVAHMIKLCKLNGINTAIDTSGCVSFENIEKAIKNCDLFLYDVKCIDSETHKKFTGVDNKLILENLKKLRLNTSNIWVRVPVIPEFNDNAEEMHKIAKFIREIDENLPVTLIPYHALAVGKYEQLGLEYKFNTDKKISNEKIDEFKKLFKIYGISAD